MAEYIDRETTCFDDCFYNPICLFRIKGDEWKKCVHFKNKADVVEVRHGEWKVVYRGRSATVYECSKCGHLEFGTSEYCVCGAKMDGKGE